MMHRLCAGITRDEYVKMSMKMNMGTRMGMNVTRNEEQYEDEHGVKMKMNMLKVSIRAEVA